MIVQIIVNQKKKKIIPNRNICVNNCLEDDIYSYEFKNICYEQCPNGTNKSLSEGFKCEIECPENLSFEKNDECFSDCNAQEFLNKLCIINNKNINAKEYIINKIENEIIDGSMNLLLLNVLNEKKQNLIIKDNNEVYTITSSYNQNNNNNNNETTINIGECENVLKKVYNISNNETLIIYKMEYNFEEFKIPIIEYEIFHPRTKEKLDLNYCNQTIINISIPVSIEEENLFKYNPLSDYYNNKCYPSNSECVSDNILEERINEFNNNYSLCENNCNYIEYNNITKKVLCECQIKNEFMKLSDILNNKNELLFQLYFSQIIETEIINDEYLCSFIDKSTNKCEDIVEFNDLINQKLIPLNTETTINQVFNLFEKELNKIINITQSEIIKGENITFHLTSTEEQELYINEPFYNNISSIDLNECENILKKTYNISDSDSLMIFKVDIKRNDSISTQIEYEVYNPYTLKKFNLSICENKQIFLYPPIDLDQNNYYLANHLKQQ